MSVTPLDLQSRVHQVGQGPPVLALAGLGCSHWIFSDLAAACAGAGRWILLDNRGMGTAPHAEEEYEITDLAEDALAVMDSLGHKTFALCGISMGGFIAQALLRMAPERVTGLILMCTTGPGPDFVPLPELSNELIRTSYGLELEQMVRINTDSTVSPNLKQRDPERYMEILNRKRDNLADMEQMILQNNAARRYMQGPALDLSQVTCPALVLHGDQDRFVDARNAQILADMLPNGRAEIAPETDHLFFLEKPQFTADHIAAFLEHL